MDIKAILITYIGEELLNGNSELDVSDNLLVDGMVDSIGILRLVNYIEELLDIKIDHDDLVIENFRSIQAIAEYLKRRGLPGNVSSVEDDAQ